MTSLSDLQRRLSRAIERGKGIRFEAEDLDLFVESGAYKTLCAAAAHAQAETSAARLEERRLAAQAAPRGHIDPEEAEAAFERAARRPPLAVARKDKAKSRKKP